MTPEEFENLVHSSSHPLIVYFWAPWCVPCRGMAPLLQEIAGQFAGQVDLIKINADESPDLMRSLNIFSIPTLSAYAAGKLLFRRTGAQDSNGLREIFSAASASRKPTLRLTPVDRLLRAGSGAALFMLGVGLTEFPKILFILSGMGLLFSSIYDRCPIYRAVATRLKTILKRRHFRSMI